jgi:hypothetical protein
VAGDLTLRPSDSASWEPTLLPAYPNIVVRRSVGASDFPTRDPTMSRR